MKGGRRWNTKKEELITNRPTANLFVLRLFTLFTRRDVIVSYSGSRYLTNPVQRPAKQPLDHQEVILCHNAILQSLQKKFQHSASKSYIVLTHQTVVCNSGHVVYACISILVSRIQWAKLTPGFSQCDMRIFLLFCPSARRVKEGVQLTLTIARNTRLRYAVTTYA